MLFSRLRPIAAALVLAVAGAGAAHASVISPSPTLPPANGVYVGATAPGCFPAAGVCVGPGTLSILSVVSSTFGPSGQDLALHVGYASAITDSHGASLGELALTGEADEAVTGRLGPNDTGTWSTALSGLDLSGSLLGASIDVGLDPAHPTLGQTSIAPLGSDFLITSFFDVFVQIEIDTPSGPLLATRGPIRVDLVATPEPGTLALLTLPLLAFALRRRRDRAGAA